MYLAYADGSSGQHPSKMKLVGLKVSDDLAGTLLCFDAVVSDIYLAFCVCICGKGGGGGRGWGGNTTPLMIYI